MTPPVTTAKPEQLARVLGPVQGFAIVVGGVIGGSIFLVPSLVAQRVPFLSGVLFVWLLGAAVSLTGVLTYCELAAMLPEAGGGYVYIRAALGPGIAFLFGWTDAFLIRAGAAATISFTFAIYFAQVVRAPFGMAPAVWQGVIAVVTILALLAVNYRGARAGANVQVAGTAMKMAALASAIILPVLLWHGKNGLTSFCFWPCGSGTGGLVAAVIPVLWTYSGWDQLTHLAEEVRDPGRNLPRVLAAGMFTVASLYLAVVIGIHLVLPYQAVAASTAVGADLFHALLGPAGTVMISVVIMLSALISANGAAMAGPRSCFAVARDGFGPAWLARVHPRFGTPANAVALVGIWSALLIAASVALMVIAPPAGLPGRIRSLWSGLQTRPLFDVLISYVMFGYLGFQALVMVSALVLRRTHPEWRRPFRVPWFPWVPIASLAATLFLMVTVARSNPVEAIAGTLIVLSGLPVWMIYRGRAASTEGHALESGSIRSK